MNRLLTPLARKLINHYQGGFPLQSRPFAQIAQKLSASEDEVISTIQSLLQQRILSRFGPLYNAAAMGGALTLAAMQVKESDFDKVATIVNAFPQVAHNYRREHALNMWFVVATESRQQLQQVLDQIEQQSHYPVYNFPKLQEFYLGLWIHIDANGLPETIPPPQQAGDNKAFKDACTTVEKRNISSDYFRGSLLEPCEARDGGAGARRTPRSVFQKVLPERSAGSYAGAFSMLSPQYKQIIRQTQQGFPLEPFPYRTLARQLGQKEAQIQQALQQMLDAGMIRRIGLVPNHYQLGLKVNAMTVWQIKPQHIEHAGKQLAQLDFVSHCYQRPPHPPLWHYNLFAMVHGYNQQQVDDKIAKIKQLLGDNCLDHATLISSAILKKTGLRLAA